MQLINGRAKFAQVYPPKMVEAVLKAIRKELINMGEISSVSEELDGVGPVSAGDDNSPTLYASEPMFAELRCQRRRFWLHEKRNLHGVINNRSIRRSH